MNISNISATSTSQQTNTQNAWRQRMQDFRALGSALQSSDLSGAQSAFSTWQSDLANSAQGSQQSGPFGKNTAANQDFQNLSNALKSGDVSGARQAFSTLTQDLRGASKARHAQGSKGAEAENDGDADDGVQSSTASSQTSNSQNYWGALNLQA